MQAAFAKFALCLGAALIALSPIASAQDLKTYAKKGDYEEVKFELSDAIIRRGLAIDYTGQLNKMLERTGADVGSSKPIYRNAEFFMFCSAKFSRDMMEADPANIGYCPYVVFVYEAAATPGEIVVGYRRPPRNREGQSERALAAIDQLLDGIIQDAVK